jgi:hypothetical protein
MPACFQLFKIGSNEPVKFVDLDDEIFHHVSDSYAFYDFDNAVYGYEGNASDAWCWNWYNTIGLALALGRDLTELARDLEGLPGEIAVYLATHYTSTAWYSRY